MIHAEKLTEMQTFKEAGEAITRLALAYPHRVTVRSIGKSAGGRDILCQTIGEGEKSAVVFSGLAPDEPVGAMTVARLAGLLCENGRLCASLGMTWHLVACAAPDAMLLGEDWFSGPFDLYHYARACYCPPALPSLETQHLLRLIDDVRPDLLIDLRSPLFLGPLFAATEMPPALAAALEEASARHQMPFAHEKPEPNGPLSYANGNGRRCLGLSVRAPRFMQSDTEELQAALQTPREDLRSFLSAQFDRVAPMLLGGDPYAAAFLQSNARVGGGLFSPGHLLGAIRQAFDGASPADARALETAYTLVDARLRMLCDEIEAAAEYIPQPVDRMIDFQLACVLAAATANG